VPVHLRILAAAVALALLAATPAAASDSIGAPAEQAAGAAPAPEPADADLRPVPPERNWAVPRLKLVPPDLAAVPTRLESSGPWLAAGNAVLADVAIWSWSKYVTKEDWADVTWESMKDNLNGPWVFDPNNFVTNQFAHPYQGSLSFTAARAAGLGFWASTPYPIVMSTLWELFAETEKPAINDAITTPVAGIFFGEVLYRLAGMVLDGGGARPGVAREIGAAAVSPMVGLTRLETGDRYRVRNVEVIPTHVELGAQGSFSGKATEDGATKETGGLVGASFWVQYGLPVPGWSLRKPFDHFDFKASLAVASTPFFNIAARGLMLGASFGEKEGSMDRGFWGLWGIYETFSPQVFRTSTSALGLGAIRQWAWGNGMALSFTGIGGVGFGAAGADRISEDARDYHFGLNSLVLLEAQLTVADRGMVSAAYRGYYIGGLVSDESQGSEAINRAEFGARLRVWGPHSLGLNVLAGRRWGTFSDRPDTHAKFSQAIASYVFTPGQTRASGLRVRD
jgi:hypothetical protein